MFLDIAYITDFSVCSGPDLSEYRFRIPGFVFLTNGLREKVRTVFPVGSAENYFVVRIVLNEEAFDIV